MLLIPCPYCGMERPEIEFRYGGEAHIARPADPSALTDDDWANFLYFRSNPKGVLAERWRHTFGCGRFFNCLRDTASDKILAVYKAGEARPDGAADRAGRAHEPALSRRGPRPDRPLAPSRSHSTASPTRATQAIRSLPRSSPTASIWSGARTNIIGREESSAPARRSPTRWSASRADPADLRPICARRRSSFMRALRL